MLEDIDLSNTVRLQPRNGAHKTVIEQGTALPKNPPSKELSRSSDDEEPERKPAKTSEPVRKPAKGKSKPVTPAQQVEERRILTQIRQLCISVFLDESMPARTLGFTSAIAGEGKSFLSTVAAIVMAEENNTPVTLLECNWDHPNLKEIFDLGPVPGLAEWLRDECSLTAIRNPVSRNLTVIHTGDAKQDAVRLLQLLRQREAVNLLERPGEMLIVDLPALVTSAYGSLAASVVESLVLVVCMGVTPDRALIETRTRLKNLRVQGMVLNQVKTRLPRWLEQAL